MPSPPWEVRRGQRGLLYLVWGRGGLRSRAVTKVKVGSGMHLWGLERDLSRERPSLPATHWPVLHQVLCASAPPARSPFTFCLLLQSLGPGISARQSPCPWFCPSASPVVWSNSGLTSCPWSLPGPPFPLASQTSPASLQGPSSSLCFIFFSPPSLAKQL